MNEFTGQTDAGPSVNYELTLSSEQAEQGVTKLLMRNGKKLQVTVPAGVLTGERRQAYQCAANDGRAAR